MAKRTKPAAKKSDRELKRSTPDGNIHETLNAAIDRIEELEARVGVLDGEAVPDVPDAPPTEAEKPAEETGKGIITAPTDVIE